LKKKLELRDGDEQDLEILRAVAKAWRGHSGSSRPMNESNAHWRDFKGNLLDSIYKQ